jgi:D-tyrosyl-tRNA(Tyr) deacylase
VRALVQRVSEASVSAEGREVGPLGAGLLVLLGVRRGDGADAADRIASKLLALRVFEDPEGKMNLSVRDVGGSILVVSQFTLYGDASRGNRPSFVEAAPPEEAEPLYERVRAALDAQGGVFGARMAVSLTNDGPVTLLLET